jgi:hypothetical protein
MSEENLSAVTSEREPKQDKEAQRVRWAWVEHRVWTDSMLRSLERGIKGGKWYALIRITNDGASASLTRPGCST